MDQLTDILQLAGQAIGLFATIAAITPTPKDDGVVLVIRQLVNILGMNFGQAKNAADRDVEDHIRAVKGAAAKAGIKKLLGK